MYDLIKKQIATDYFNQRFSNDGQRFVAWYLRNVLVRDMNETRDDITDEPTRQLLRQCADGEFLGNAEE